MAPIATADGLASLDCNDSGLSYAANIAGLLTFVAAIVLSFRLSMRTTRGIYDALEQMSIKHALNHEDRRMHDRLDTLNMIRQKYGPMMPIRIREWAFRDRLKHWDERYHTLYERVRSVLFCKLNVHKPVLWMWRSGDGWAGKELEKIQMDGEKLLAELRGFNEDLVHKVEQSTHDLLK